MIAIPPLLRFLSTEEVNTVTVNLDRLVASRMLLQASSGGGKSWALRYLLEQTHGQIQHLVLDPEGEFSSLRQQFPYILVGEEADVPAHPSLAGSLCRQLVELEVSAVINLFDLKLPLRRQFVKHFLEELLSLPNNLWHPLLLVLDEAHQYCPERGAGEAESTQAVIDLCTLGRKRGYAPVLATQRLSKLHKDAAAELKNKLIGSTGLDVDVRRAGDDLGFDKKQRETLKSLPPGTFYAVGPAISNVPLLIRTGEVMTSHPQPGKVTPPLPPPPEQLSAAIDQLRILPSQSDASPTADAATQGAIASYEQQIADLKVQLATLPTTAPIFQAGEVERLETAAHSLVDLGAQLLDAGNHLLSAGNAILERLNAAVATLEALPSNHPPTVVEHRHPVANCQLPSQSAPTPKVPNSPNLQLKPSQQRMLNVLGELESLGIPALQLDNLAIFSGQSPKSSGPASHARILSTTGLIQRLNHGFALTELGRSYVESTAMAQINSISELHQAWLHWLQNKYTDGHAEFLRLLLAAHPQPLTRDHLATSVGYSLTSSGPDAKLSDLETLGLIHKHPGKLIGLAPLLFPTAVKEH